jgi:hypothetical protein
MKTKTALALTALLLSSPIGPLWSQAAEPAPVGLLDLRTQPASTVTEKAKNNSKAQRIVVVFSGDNQALFDRVTRVVQAKKDGRWPIRGIILSSGPSAFTVYADGTARPAFTASSETTDKQIEDEIAEGYKVILHKRVESRIAELDEKMAHERAEYARHQRNYEQAQADLARTKLQQEALAKVRALHENQGARKQIIALLERGALDEKNAEHQRLLKASGWTYEWIMSGAK